MDDDSNEHLSEKDKWIKEAEAVINDIKHHVNSVEISKKLPSDNQCIYLNLSTLEKGKFCIEMSCNGFQIVGNKYDDNSTPTDNYFETPYSLLNSMSVHFKNSFGNELIDKLNLLVDKEGDAK